MYLSISKKPKYFIKQSSAIRFICFTLMICFCAIVRGQRSDSQIIKSLFEKSLTSGGSYYWLGQIANNVGARPIGSVSYRLAQDYVKSILDSLHPSKIYLQPVKTPTWVRGAPEFAYFETGLKTTSVSICAMGGSVSTPSGGLKAGLIEVKTIDELSKINPEKIKGKIVFLNLKMNDSWVNLTGEYRRIAKIYSQSAVSISKYGAAGVLLRSLTTNSNDEPYTGTVYYDNLPLKSRIPVASISPNGADLLESVLSLNPKIQFYFSQFSQIREQGRSNNIIAELRGTKFPNDIIVVGAHLDSWDLGDGIHDNATGCVQAIEVINLLKMIKYKPKRTIRVVLFANKEYGLYGVKGYKKITQNKQMIFALENNSGGFMPLGFSLDCNDTSFKKVKKWETLLHPYNIFKFVRRKSGLELEVLKTKTNTVAELLTANQRYYDYIHSKEDKYATVNRRELQLGAATLTSLIYLVDKYGL